MLMDAVDAGFDMSTQAGIDEWMRTQNSPPGAWGPSWGAGAPQKRKARPSAKKCSLHHMAPEVFGGFEETPRGAKVATAEKALFDFAYLSSGRSRLFTSLPELELPRRFKRKELGRWVARIPSLRSRTLTAHKLEELLSKASGVRDTRAST